MNIEQTKKELGLRIKAYRTSKNFTQEQFCSIVNLEQPNLSNIENGKNFPDFNTLCAIIQKTDIEIDFLLGFLKADKTKYHSIDYEILDLLLNLPEESKIKIKNVIELIK